MDWRSSRASALAVRLLDSSNADMGDANGFDEKRRFDSVSVSDHVNEFTCPRPAPAAAPL
jgi:hypothetical protein